MIIEYSINSFITNQTNFNYFNIIGIVNQMARISIELHKIDFIILTIINFKKVGIVIVIVKNKELNYFITNQVRKVTIIICYNQAMYKINLIKLKKYFFFVFYLFF